MTAEHNKLLVRRLVEEAVNPGNLEVPDEITEGSLPRPHPAGSGTTRDSFPDFTTDVADLGAHNQKAAAQFPLFRHLREWTGHPPTGRRFQDVDEIYIFPVSESLFVRIKVLCRSYSRRVSALPRCVFAGEPWPVAFLAAECGRRLAAPPGRSFSLRCGRSTWTCGCAGGRVAATEEGPALPRAPAGPGAGLAARVGMAGHVVSVLCRNDSVLLCSYDAENMDRAGLGGMTVALPVIPPGRRSWCVPASLGEMPARSPM